MRYAYWLAQFFYRWGFVKTGSYLARFLKNALGVYNTFIIKRTTPYTDAWWDETFYASQISDSQTINRSMDRFSTQYHYASVELLITRALFERAKQTQLDSVLDIGSGAGHWIKFYASLGATKICGVDVSQKAVEFLQKEYEHNEHIRLKHGPADLMIDSFETKFDLVNAIGVMFHIVDDTQWEATLSTIANHLNSGGYLVVGGYFGWLNGLNVQADKNGVNKRLRSRFVWKRTLKALGFEDITLIKNKASYEIARILPESHILIAKKK